MDKKFVIIKTFYDKGYWNKRMVHDAVIKGWITEKEANCICNKNNEL